MQFKQAFGAHDGREAAPDHRRGVAGEPGCSPSAGVAVGRALASGPSARRGKIQAFQAAQNEVRDRALLRSQPGVRGGAQAHDRSGAGGVVRSQRPHGARRRSRLRAVGDLTSRRRIAEGDRCSRSTALGSCCVSSPRKVWRRRGASGLADASRRLIGALRALGPSSPVTCPSAAEALDRLVTASLGRRFEQRLRALPHFDGLS